MHLPIEAIPPAVLLIGAISLTVAFRRVAPMSWALSGLYRFGPLALALVLATVYCLVVLPGRRSQLMVAAEPAQGFAGILLLGIGAGFIIRALMLLIPRKNE